MNILCIGDIVGKSGRNFINTRLPKLIQEYKIDFVVANGENVAHGVGITKNTYDELVYAGVDVITLGNHTWAKREVLEFINDKANLIRPANFPTNNPGNGYTIVEKAGKRVAVINLVGRVYMESYDCPFKKVDEILSKIEDQADIIIVDFHAEATSEKLAMGWYLDGRVAAVFGTHTHVQTSDERLMPQGTAYITDVGMTGPYNSILGVEKDIIIKKFVTLMPGKFEVADGFAIFTAILLEADDNKAVSIKRLNILEE
ncbi:MAG: metallophosphoesterase [Clostridia bacterium]|jgi:metallophosphoesterase (TIGR00282 family)|nr:metallophosphoesterase [Clostridia bacterium]